MAILIAPFRLGIILLVHCSEDDGCHSEPEQRGGEESRRTENCTRDSSACGLRMTGPQNQCDRTLVRSGSESTVCLFFKREDLPIRMRDNPPVYSVYPRARDFCSPAFEA